MSSIFIRCISYHSVGKGGEKNVSILTRHPGAGLGHGRSPLLEGRSVVNHKARVTNVPFHGRQEW